MRYTIWTVCMNYINSQCAILKSACLMVKCAPQHRHQRQINGKTSSENDLHDYVSVFSLLTGWVVAFRQFHRTMQHGPFIVDCIDSPI